MLVVPRAPAPLVRWQYPPSSSRPKQHRRCRARRAAAVAAIRRHHAWSSPITPRSAARIQAHIQPLERRAGRLRRRLCPRAHPHAHQPEYGYSDATAVAHHRAQRSSLGLVPCAAVLGRVACDPHGWRRASTASGCPRSSRAGPAGPAWPRHALSETDARSATNRRMPRERRPHRRPASRRQHCASTAATRRPGGSPPLRRLRLLVLAVRRHARARSVEFGQRAAAVARREQRTHQSQRARRTPGQSINGSSDSASKRAPNRRLARGFAFEPSPLPSRRHGSETGGHRRVGWRVASSPRLQRISARDRPRPGRHGVHIQGLAASAHSSVAAPRAE